jgi:hypothetical protein
MGQLTMLSVALFFFSCEDENSIIGYPNPNKKFQVYTVDIPLQTSVVLLDSVITDNKSLQSFISLIGAYNDNVMGPMRAESYLQLFPTFTQRINAAAEYDSVTFQVKLNYYSYGLSDDRTESFTVHAISGDSLNRTGGHSYYYNDRIAYDAEPLGTATVHLDYDSIQKQYTLASNQQDTLLVRGKLEDYYGRNLFNVSQQSDFVTRDEIRNFITVVKGLTVLPAESTAILGVDLYSNLSRVTLHYHTTTDTLESYFVINPASFTNFSVDRSASELAGVMPYQQTEPASGNRFVQNGAPVTTKIDLSNFYAFADSDTTENILINEAQFIIDNVESPVGLAPHSSLRFRLMKEDNLFANAKMAADVTAFKYYHLISDGVYYAVQGDNPSQTNPYSLISYDSEEQEFSGYMTLFAQSLLNNKDSDGVINENRLRYLALFSNSPFVSRTVNRTVFNKDNIKLRITYTRPTQTNSD